MTTVLVTGSTGTVGSRVVDGLADRNVTVRAATRNPESATVPDGVETVLGRPARPLAQWVAANAGTFEPGADSPEGDRLTTGG